MNIIQKKLPNYLTTQLPNSCLWRPALSLVELLIGSAIFGVVAVMVGSIYLGHFKLFNNQNVSIDTSNQNRLALDEIVNQVREGQSVMVSCCTPQESSGAQKLIVGVWPLDATGQPFDPNSPTCTINCDYIIYYCEANCAPPNTTPTKLRKKIVPQPTSSRTQTDSILSTRVKDLQLQYFDAAQNEITNPALLANTAMAKITLTNESTTFTTKPAITYTQETKVILRNK